MIINNINDNGSGPWGGGNNQNPWGKRPNSNGTPPDVDKKINDNKIINSIGVISDFIGKELGLYGRTFQSAGEQVISKQNARINLHTTSLPLITVTPLLRTIKSPPPNKKYPNT